MKIINASATIIDFKGGEETLRKLEKYGRVCYKSENKITEDSAEEFVRGLISRGHESVLEHAGFTARFICDRGVSHEIVQHRIASYSQESSRYCNYSNDKFGSEITVIAPTALNLNANAYAHWEWGCKCAEKAYFQMLAMGATPQEARAVLPNSLKTELVVTMNLRSWRNFFQLRCATAAHPQMRELATMLLEQAHEQIQIVFDDIWEELGVKTP